ncbi:MAG: hypothetical protein Kapaf2KO_11750 [Candidatus Kapaibacteriales bacterium]
MSFLRKNIAMLMLLTLTVLQSGLAFTVHHCHIAETTDISFGQPDTEHCQTEVKKEVAKDDCCANEKKNIEAIILEDQLKVECSLDLITNDESCCESFSIDTETDIIFFNEKEVDFHSYLDLSQTKNYLGAYFIEDATILNNLYTQKIAESPPKLLATSELKKLISSIYFHSQANDLDGSSLL